MLLSIIVPVYNMAAGGKLNFCMDSLVAQTLPGESYEIIAVDDASTDNSLDILRDYEERYGELVRVIHYDTNRRQGGAKNEGLKAASGKWIGFIDSDDWVTPDYYEKLIRRADETGADMVGCDYSLVNEHTYTVGRVVSNNSLSQTGLLDEEKHGGLLMRPGSMVIKIYRHSVIKENRLSFPENIFYEDNCAGSVWSLYFKHFEKVEEPMYFYYQHEVSTVHGISEEKCRDRLRAAELMYSECRDRGFLEKYRAEIEYRFAELYYVNTLFSYMSALSVAEGGISHLKFIKELRQGIDRYFPDFEKNKYYISNTADTEKRFISLHGRSNSAFYVYYRLKQFIWSHR
ncbi:MAG: glycosyltransferase [Lachnospiraceae bacterium]|nr:glycosyltransferase [Lachnospiraceae bacterium]